MFPNAFALIGKHYRIATKQNVGQAFCVEDKWLKKAVQSLQVVGGKKSLLLWDSPSVLFFWPTQARMIPDILEDLTLGYLMFLTEHTSIYNQVVLVSPLSFNQPGHVLPNW